MAYKKVDSGWQVDIRLGGRGGKRYRKTFKTKAEAQRWASWMQSNAASDVDWQPSKKDTRRLSSLVSVWYDGHGSQLSDGERRRKQLLAMAEQMGDPLADRFTAALFIEFRKERIAAGVTPNTVNHDHAYLRAMFNELKRMGVWSGANPVQGVRRFKIAEPELVYLTPDQVRELLASLRQSRNPDAYLVALVCLGTGARWSEAEYLRLEQVGQGAITYTKTKSGKNRTVPADRALLDLLPTKSGRLFRPSYDAFRTAVSRAGIELPKGQLSHVLRHTFASYFMQNGGNILTLQRILGHQSLAMTMRYAHMAPDHLKEAVNLNPLASLSLLRGGRLVDTR